MDLAEESLLAELIMSRRLDFGKDFHNRQARYGLSVKDEAEWMENDAAARWLRKMKTVHCGKQTIVCQINKLRLLERNHRAEKA
jgi:hypothetical protein